MKRGEFLKTSTAGLAAGAALFLTHPGKYEQVLSGSSYDIVAVMGGEPDAMFDTGIQEYGGMSAFISKGQKVLVKPNIGWDVNPEMGATTNPALVRRIVEQCFSAGAKEVYVLDHTCDNWVNSYRNSGIEKAARSVGAKVVPAHTENYYQEISIPGGKSLTSVKVHELLLEADVIINVPVLKDHNSTRLTACLKNMMGVVWDRAFWHSNNLDQCIADYASYAKKPVLNVIDCYKVMVKNGPRGISPDDLMLMRSQILTRDWIAGDAAAAKMLGVPLEKISYLNLAHNRGLGKANLDIMNIRRIKM